jgi:methylmalonyl-CoA mutase C-terminal domain/subunit
MKEKGVTDVALFAGGVIPPRDVEKIKAMGVKAVFTPGTRRSAVLEMIDAVLQKDEGGL